MKPNTFGSSRSKYIKTRVWATVSLGRRFLVVVGGARAGCFLLRKSLEAAADFFLLEPLKLFDWWPDKADS